ncbi:hypothetical protein PNA2_0624 [Pyrococcus sp. NA2]|uniref:THUMP domain-containing protein n=1 Tax=Pyrococcus sp. (strain NA2) TaxID=342949 RepID=UPI000209AC35|nr:THUMP domain-containing protein [Pyrococcus sp. NA2]AEC51539.1 hypothetical protein PNA2_0624 [Pyrococcus sp. NA2]
MKFIATCPPGREGDAILELEWSINAKVRRTKWRGVLVGETDLPKEDAIKRLRSFETFALQRLIPLDSIVDLEKLEEEVKDLCQKIPRGKKFAVRAKVRGSKIGEKKIEREIGGIIKRITGNPVDLENPEVIVVIEILGKKAGIGVLEPGELLKFNVKP